MDLCRSIFRPNPDPSGDGNTDGVPVNVRQILSFWLLAVRPLRAEFASSLSCFGRNRHHIGGPSNSLQTKKMVSWLGGLDSNQDNQIQSLMSYRLNDLPAAGGDEKESLG